MSNPDETLAQEEVLAQLHSALASDTRTRANVDAIAATLEGGTLTLSGEVTDIAAKRLAARAGAGMPGVRTVADKLTVRATENRDDAALRDAVVRHLLEEPVFRNCTLSVHVDDHDELLHQEPGESASGNVLISVAGGVVTLSGQVISLSHRRLAGVLAWWAPGCRCVENEVLVVPAEEDNDDELVDALMLVLEKDPTVHTEQLRVRSRNGVVTMYGFVRNREAKHMAEIDAWQMDGVRDVVNRIEVAHI